MGILKEGRLKRAEGREDGREGGRGNEGRERKGERERKAVKSGDLL